MPEIETVVAAMDMVVGIMAVIREDGSESQAIVGRTSFKATTARTTQTDHPRSAIVSVMNVEAEIAEKQVLIQFFELEK